MTHPCTSGLLNYPYSDEHRAQQVAHVPVLLFVNASVCVTACGRLLCMCARVCVCKLSVDSLCPRLFWVTIERTQELLFHSEPTKASIPSPSAVSCCRGLTIYIYCIYICSLHRCFYHLCMFHQLTRKLSLVPQDDIMVNHSSLWLLWSCISKPNYNFSLLNIHYTSTLLLVA